MKKAGIPKEQIQQTFDDDLDFDDLDDLDDIDDDFDFEDI